MKTRTFLTGTFFGELLTALIILLIILACASCGKSEKHYKACDNYYIDAINGNDTNSGCHPDSALLTLNEAWLRMYIDDTLFIIRDPLYIYSCKVYQDRPTWARIYIHDDGDTTYSIAGTYNIDDTIDFDTIYISDSDWQLPPISISEDDFISIDTLKL